MLSPGNVDCAEVNIPHLPEEILLETLQYLDIESILAIRQTCRTFYQATKSRQLWYTLIKELQARQVRRPEEPLEEYSTRELEKWVSRRLRAQILWNSSTPPVTHHYPLLDFGSGIFSQPHILAGGRWLLVLMDGKVYTVDLDTLQLEAHLLFDPGTSTEEGMHDELTEFCHWIDDTKPRLSFRVGLCGEMGGVGSYPFTFTRIILYQVELRGHGSDATLFAEPLAYMKSIGKGSRPQICLNEEYFVEFLSSTTGAISYQLRSYRYNTNEVRQGAHSVKPYVLVIENFVRFMDFISDNQLVFFDDHCLHILAISPSEDDVQHTITLLHTIPSPNSLSFSRLYQTSHSTFKMVVFGGDEVRGVEIPNWDPSATVITKLGHQEYYRNFKARVAVGLSASVITNGNDGTMDLLSYSWERGEDVTFSCRSCSVGLYQSDTVVLSEDLARIVIEGQNGISLILLHRKDTIL